MVMMFRKCFQWGNSKPLVWSNPSIKLQITYHFNQVVSFFLFFLLTLHSRLSPNNKSPIIRRPRNSGLNEKRSKQSNCSKSMTTQATSGVLPLKLSSESDLWRRSRRSKLITAAAAARMEFGGMDSDGRTFASVDEMWREAIGDASNSNGNSNKAQWYSDGVAYWQNVEASVDGVLGGYGHVNDEDIKGSEAFLTSILHDRLRVSPRRDNEELVALDCGSGIGRITSNLLLKHFNQVDLLEPVSHFLEAARKNLAGGGGVEVEVEVDSQQHSAVNFFCTPLQEFTPESGRYHVIWVQWCIGHLTDDDFVSFFKRAKTGLKPGGFFILKENIAKTGFVLDKEDRSITRSDLYFRQLFNQCGLHLYKVEDQKGLPDELFAVKMYALTVDKPKSSNKRKSKRQTNRPGII